MIGSVHMSTNLMTRSVFNISLILIVKSAFSGGWENRCSGAADSSVSESYANSDDSAADPASHKACSATTHNSCESC